MEAIATRNEIEDQGQEKLADGPAPRHRLLSVPGSSFSHEYIDGTKNSQLAIIRILNASLLLLDDHPSLLSRLAKFIAVSACVCAVYVN